MTSFFNIQQSATNSTLIASPTMTSVFNTGLKLDHYHLSGESAFGRQTDEQRCCNAEVFVSLWLEMVQELYVNCAQKVTGQVEPEEDVYENPDVSRGCETLEKRDKGNTKRNQQAEQKGRMIFFSTSKKCFIWEISNIEKVNYLNVIKVFYTIPYQ